MSELGVPQAHVLGDNRHVAGQREAGTPAQRIALDGCDDGFGNL